MLDQPVGVPESALGDGLHKGETSPRGLGLQAQFQVGRALVQAEAAVDAAVKLFCRDAAHGQVQQIYG